MLRNSTTGNKIYMDHNGEDIVFTAGGRKRHCPEGGSYGEFEAIVNGVVRFADGDEAHALLAIDESSGCEHCGTGIFLSDGGFVWLYDKDAFQRLGKARDEVYPFKYKYTASVKGSLYDHHVGADGWSL